MNKRVEDLKPGDKIILHVPCELEVVSVDENAGRRSYEGNKILRWKMSSAPSIGSSPIGSLVHVEMVPDGT